MITITGFSYLSIQSRQESRQWFSLRMINRHYAIKSAKIRPEFISYSSSRLFSFYSHVYIPFRENQRARFCSRMRARDYLLSNILMYFIKKVKSPSHWDLVYIHTIGRHAAFIEQKIFHYLSSLNVQRKHPQQRNPPYPTLSLSFSLSLTVFFCLSLFPSSIFLSSLSMWKMIL